MTKKKVQISAQADFRFAPTVGANIYVYRASGTYERCIATLRLDFLRSHQK